MINFLADDVHGTITWDCVLSYKVRSYTGLVVCGCKSRVSPLLRSWCRHIKLCNSLYIDMIFTPLHGMCSPRGEDLPWRHNLVLTEHDDSFVYKYFVLYYIIRGKARLTIPSVNMAMKFKGCRSMGNLVRLLETTAVEAAIRMFYSDLMAMSKIFIFFHTYTSGNMGKVCSSQLVFRKCKCAIVFLNWLPEGTVLSIVCCRC